ncbi:MAG TPA: hypothetical protein VGC82_20180, partial [Rhodopila sp.]
MPQLSSLPDQNPDHWSVAGQTRPCHLLNQISQANHFCFVYAVSGHPHAIIRETNVQPRTFYRG